MSTQPSIRDFPEAQIYSFAGYIAGREGSERAAVRTGLARACSHNQVIEQMGQWGFRVTAVSALPEMRQALEVLESIAAGHDDVGPSDYVSFLDTPAPYPAEKVFMLGGRPSESGTSMAGFAVAADAAALEQSLAAVQFSVDSSTSLAELRLLIQEMAGIQEGDEGVIDLIALAIAA